MTRDTCTCGHPKAWHWNHRLECQWDPCPCATYEAKKR